MMDFSEILGVLATGADAATWLILYFLWRIERRVLALEVKES